MLVLIITLLMKDCYHFIRKYVKVSPVFCFEIRPDYFVFNFFFYYKSITPLIQLYCYFFAICSIILTRQSFGIELLEKYSKVVLKENY